MPVEEGGDKSQDRSVDGEWRGNGDRWWRYGCRKFSLLKVVVMFFHGHRKEHSLGRGVYSVGRDSFDKSVEAM